MNIDNWATKQLIGNLRVKADPFGIYAQRRALAKALPKAETSHDPSVPAPAPFSIYRGDEWWTRAADKIIQDEFDAVHVRTVPRESMEVVA